ncbi:PREDICTED: interferon gamma [Elephantulus edwardii]|uniref:interferon gamma n=1 Tax=Elephantulus edwardii TaxID=28737 RepID=UPI0003F0A908|nr:PREDICTED: interferon gamma [Elephantulus edwardii]
MNYTSYFLVLQLCIILGSSSCYCEGSFWNEIQILKEYLNATDSSVADGGPLFLGFLRNLTEESDQKIFQSQIVSIYFKIFQNLEHHERIKENIKSSIKAIREDLFAKFFNSDKTKISNFTELIKTPVDDRMVQRKAVSELFKVVQDYLSSTPNLRKRKRRQNLFRGRRASK